MAVPRTHSAGIRNDAAPTKALAAMNINAKVAATRARRPMTLRLALRTSSDQNRMSTSDQSNAFT